MEVRVHLEPFTNQETAQTGGGYGLTTYEIHIDNNMDAHNQRETIIHEIIEQFCPMWPHDAVDLLTEAIMTGLEELENVH